MNRIIISSLAAALAPVGDSMRTSLQGGAAHFATSGTPVCSGMTIMTHVRALALSVLSLCALSAAAHGQDGKSPAGSVNWSVAPIEKAVPKKKVAGQPAAGLPAADDGKAARLEEGRKKFFQQSSGFDHSSMWDKSNMNMGSGGKTPGVGFGF